MPDPKKKIQTPPERVQIKKVLAIDDEIHLPLESITDGFISIDKNWNYTHVNEEAAHLSQNTRESLIGQNLHKVHSNFKQSIFYKKYNEVMETGKPTQFEFYYSDIDQWYYIIVYPTEEGVAVYFSNVSESKGYIKKLAESEERYRLLIENVKDYAIFMLDPEGQITTWNKGVGRILGYDESEIRGSHFSRLYIPEDVTAKKPIKELQKAKLNGRVEQESWYKRKDGTCFWADRIITAVYDENKKLLGFSNLVRDITERKKTEEALKERTVDLEKTKEQIEFEKALDEALLDSIGEGVIATDKKGKIMFMNKQAEELFVVRGAHFKGRYFHEVWTTWNEAGDKVPLAECAVTEVLKTSKKIVSAAYNYSSKHRKKFPAAITASPVILGTSAVGVIIVFRDIRREKEIDRAKSEFVSLASHQLRTPLTAIKLFCEMLMSGGAGSLNDDQRQILRNIEKSNRKMVELVDDLLNISRLESQKLKVSPSEFDLVSFTKGVLESSELTSLSKDRKPQFITNHTELPVYSDPKLLTQVISNLVSNAIKYSKPASSKQKPQIDVIVEQINDKNYCIAVKDNGIGVPKHAQKKIFTKLYRADNAIKTSTDGNGLGLYMCKMMLESIGGKIWFESEEGKGTTFFVQIPAKKIIS